jgi:hypothetical protein
MQRRLIKNIYSWQWRANFGPPAQKDHPPPRCPFLTPHTNLKGCQSAQKCKQVSACTVL